MPITTMCGPWCGRDTGASMTDQQPDRLIRVRLVDWRECAVNGVRDLPVLVIDDVVHVVDERLVLHGSLRAELEQGTTVDDVPHEMRDLLRWQVRLFRITGASELTPDGMTPVAVPVLRIDQAMPTPEAAVVRRMLAWCVRNPEQRGPYVSVDHERDAWPGSHEPDWKAPWVLLDEMVAGPRPLCPGSQGPECCRPVEVAWRSQRFPLVHACAWHWPTQMGLEPHPEVVAVWSPAGWRSWRDLSEWERFRDACLLFSAAATVESSGRPLAPAEGADRWLAGLYRDVEHGRAALGWAATITNPALGTHALDVVLALHADASALQPDTSYFLDRHAVSRMLLSRGQAAVEAGDPGLARQLWKLSAEAVGSTDALHELGHLAYSNGDLDEAHVWWLRGAQVGSAHCMGSLGALFGQRGDQQTATLWLEKAARQGSTTAMFNLGVLAETAGNVPLAQQWFTLAAQAGDPSAASAVAQLSGAVQRANSGSVTVRGRSGRRR